MTCIVWTVGFLQVILQRESDNNIMPNKSIFLPTRESLILFIDEALIPQYFEYGENEDRDVSLVVAQVLKYNIGFNFMERFNEAFRELEEKHMAIKYYTPQLYQKTLGITNEGWNDLIHTGSGLSILGNIALSQTLSQTSFDSDTIDKIAELKNENDFFPNTGVINLDHLKETI